MDPSILINWTSPFPILGVSGVFFIFIFSISNRYIFRLANSEDPDQTPRCVWSGSALFALVPKWDAKLIRVKTSFFSNVAYFRKKNVDEFSV